MNRKEKIAICFLVTKNIVNLDVWEKWWNGYEDFINIYAHFSVIGNITQPVLLKNRVEPVPTKWGDISLVIAEGQLYKEALKNPSNKFFALVSDTCIPVRSFEYTYKRLFNDSSHSRPRGLLGYRVIDRFSPDDASPFTPSDECNRSIEKSGVYGRTRRGKNQVYASDQWKILNRSNAKAFLKMLEDKEAYLLYTNCIKIVPDSLAPDELMYVNWMNKKTKGQLKKHFRDFASTFVDFKGKAIHPINYKQMTKGISDEICYSNTLFARKFPDPIKNRLIRQTPVVCYKKRSIQRGVMKGAISPPRQKRKSRKNRKKSSSPRRRNSNKKRKRRSK